MRFPDLPPVAKTGMLGELREGWRDFISRRWFWTIVLALGVIVAVSTGAGALGGGGDDGPASDAQRRTGWR